MTSNLFNSEVPNYSFKNIDELYNLITGNTSNCYTPIKSNLYNSEKKELFNKFSSEKILKRKIDFSNSFSKNKGKKTNKKFIYLINFNFNYFDNLDYQKKIKDEEDVKKFKYALDKIFSTKNRKIIKPFFTNEWLKELENENAKKN